MEGKFVGFQILERDAERGQIYPYPATAEDVATQLRTMGYVVSSHPVSPWPICVDAPGFSTVREERKIMERRPFDHYLKMARATDGIIAREHEALLEKLSDPRAKALGRAALTKANKAGQK